MAAPQHPDVLGGVQHDMCSFWFLLSHDEPRFNGEDGDDSSECGIEESFGCTRRGSRRRKERLWSQRLAAKVRSTDGGGPNDKAGKIVVPIEQADWKIVPERRYEYELHAMVG